MSNEHEHCHSCEHNTPQESLALLKYMISHNKHHNDELHEIAHTLDGDAKQLVHAAIIDFEKANDKLEQALAMVEKSEG